MVVAAEVAEVVPPMLVLRVVVEPTGAPADTAWAVRVSLDDGVDGGVGTTEHLHQVSEFPRPSSQPPLFPTATKAEFGKAPGGVR